MRDHLLDDEIPEELVEHAEYIESILVGADDAALTHRIHPEHGPQLVIVVPTALDLIDLGRCLESARDHVLGFNVEQDELGRFQLVVDTSLMD